MSSADSPRTIDAALMSLRVIHVALVTGLLAFLGVAISQKGALPTADIPWTNLSYVLVGTAVVALVAAYLVPPSLTASARLKAGRLYAQNPQAGPGEDSYWLGHFRQIFLIRAALFEAGGLALVLDYLLEGQPLSYWASWLFVVAFLLYFPTRGGLRAWIDTQRELVKQERS